MNELQIRQMQISRAKDEIRCCNELNQIYGLTLTEADITELVELRGQALRSTGRVEFGGGILPKLIRAFLWNIVWRMNNMEFLLKSIDDRIL